MTHVLQLLPKYYDFIKDGTKRIELRLYDEKRSTINLGDVIEFSKSDNDKFCAKVIGLLRYASFTELFNDFEIGILADNSMTKSELLSDLDRFYSKADQDKFGFIGIRIELIPSQITSTHI